MVEPRFKSVPKGNGDLGDEAMALCKEAGIKLDEWQELPLRASLLRRKDGKWSAPDVGLNVARQNGKGEVIIARILAELYLVRSPLTIYSAHNFDTALEHFRRLVWIIEDSPRLRRELLGAKGERTYGIRWGKGNESIELRDGQRLHIRTRTASGGRGFSCDLLILDEAMILPEYMHSALKPIVSARPNAQTWYTGSAVDQQIHEHGVVWARVRERGIAVDKDLAYFEWSVEGENPDMLMPEPLHDRAAWAAANPALGIRIAPETVERESRGDLGRRGFAVERLGIGDWPRTDYLSQTMIDLDAWIDLVDPDSVLQNPVCIAFDVSPERVTSICAAGMNQAGKWHIELTDNRKGTGWVADRIVELAKRHSPAAIVCDGYGPAASLVPAIQEALDGLEVMTFSAGEHSQACGQLVDAVNDGTLRHLGDSDIIDAIRVAVTRPLGDAWAWSRKNSSANISPLVSATLALSAAMVYGKQGAFVLA